MTSLPQPPELPMVGCEFINEMVGGFGDLQGTEVSVFSAIPAPEDAQYIDSWAQFESCTGITVQWENSDNFATEVLERTSAGDAPDIAFFPQPGVLADAVSTGAVLPAPDPVASQVEEWWDASWREYGTIDGTLYGAPLGASVKSLVWYSPAAFAEAGYTVPESWKGLLALTERIASEQSGKPWCAGISAGESTGWPATDWVEDLMLRLHGREAYDDWVGHELPFNAPQMQAVLDEVAKILKDGRYVNGGFGAPRTIGETTVRTAGLPILDGECWLHKQSSAYQAQWAGTAEIGPDGDVFAFYFPTVNDDFGQPVLGSGDFVAAFADRPEVVAFQTYLASPLWANEKAAVSGAGWLSANTGLDVTQLQSEVDRLAAQLMQNDDTVFAFDASDLMPPAVGAGSFWDEMTAWLSDGKDGAAALDAIEASWPD